MIKSGEEGSRRHGHRQIRTKSWLRCDGAAAALQQCAQWGIVNVCVCVHTAAWPRPVPLKRGKGWKCRDRDSSPAAAAAAAGKLPQLSREGQCGSAAGGWWLVLARLEGSTAISALPHCTVAHSACPGGGTRLTASTRSS